MTQNHTMPTPLTDAHLEALLAAPQSDHVECKEAWARSAPEKSQQAVCVFAKDLPRHKVRPTLVKATPRRNP